MFSIILLGVSTEDFNLPTWAVQLYFAKEEAVFDQIHKSEGMSVPIRVALY